jgi:purine-nucleoside phosphorylase
MKNAYDRVLRRRAHEAACSIGLDLKEGVYTMMGGPNFETPAELRLMKLQGIDAVGENFFGKIFKLPIRGHALCIC